MSNDERNYPDLKDSINLVWRWFGYTIIASILQYLLIGNDRKSTLVQFTDLLVYSLPLIATILFAMSRMNQNRPGIRIIKLDKVSMDVILAGIITANAISILIEPILLVFPMPEILKKMFEELIQYTLLSFLTVAIAAPILEEVLCRGIMLNGLLRKYEPTKAIVLSAAIFAAIHLNPWQGFNAFFPGLLLGWLYVRTRSLLPSILVHFVNNTESFLFGDATLYTKVPAALLIPVLCVTIYAGVWWIDKRTNKYVPEPIDATGATTEFSPEDE